MLVREVVNFSSYWRSATFSSTVEPTIYLLAFGFGFGSLVSRVGGYDYVEFVGTGTVATAVLFSSAFPAMFGTFVKYQFQRTYDAILAAPVDTEELVTAEALWIATRAGVYGCVPMLVAMVFGLDPAWGMLAVPLIAWVAGLRLGVLRDHDRRLREVDRELQLHRQRRADAALPRRGHVLPDRPAAATGRSSSANVNPLHHCVELVRHAAFGFEGWSDLARVGALLAVRPADVAGRDPRDDAQAGRLARRLVAADEGAQALVLLAARGAPCQVRAEPGDGGIDVGAGQLELDVAVELVEAGIAADLRLGWSEQTAECVVEVGAFAHVASSRSEPTESPHSSRCLRSFRRASCSDL